MKTITVAAIQFLVLLAVLSRSDAAACGAGSFTLTSTCAQCPYNTYVSTTDALECNICFNGTQPNALGNACEECPPGSAKPLHDNGWHHESLRLGAMALRAANSAYFVCRFNSGNAIRIRTAFKSETCTWLRVPAVNGQSGYFSLVDPSNPNRHLTQLLDGAIGGRDFLLNMTTTSGTTSWKNRATWSASSTLLAQPNDADNMPIQNYNFLIHPYNNASMAIDCDLPKQVTGAQDGDCFVRNRNALGAYRQATFRVAPPTTHTDTLITTAPVSRVYECDPVTVTVPTEDPDNLVSFQPFSNFATYPLVGTNNLLYGQSAALGLNRALQTFRIVPALDGTANAVSFQDPAAPTRFVHARLAYRTRGLVSASVEMGTPEAASDASFSLNQGCSNGTYGLDFLTLRNTLNNTYYFYMNMTSDRSNPVIMKNISNPLSVLTWQEKERVTWRLVRGLSTNTRLEHDYAVTIKSRSATKLLGHDETNRLLYGVTYTGSVTAAVVNLNLIAPVGYVADAACSRDRLFSISMFDSTTGEIYYAYAFNTTVSGDAYASYTALTTRTPGSSAGVAFPQSFVFCAVPSVDPATYQWGFAITLSNDTGTTLLATGTAYTFTRPVSATQKQQATFVLSGPVTTSYISAKSHSLNCQSCVPGRFAATYGRENCSVCAVGTYAADYGSTVCTQCAAGTYQGSEGAESCTNCAAGTSSPAGATTCADCDAGFTSVAGSPCVECPAGHYSSAGDAECSPCPAGSYSAAGASECTLCPAGSFSAIEGSAECVLCAVNSFADTTGKTACTACGLNECFTDVLGSSVSLACGSATPATVLGKANCLAATLNEEGKADCLPDSWKWATLVSAIVAGVLLFVVIAAWCRKGSGYTGL